MIKNELDAYIRTRAEILNKVLTFHLLHRIKLKYKTPQALFADIRKLNVMSKDNDKTRDFFNKWFHLDPQIILKICTRPIVDGKQVKITKQVLSLIPDTELVQMAMINRTYNTKKVYTVWKRYMLPKQKILDLWDNADALDSKSAYYTREEHKAIDKYILGYKNDKTDVKREKNVKSNKNDKIKTPENDIPDVDEAPERKIDPRGEILRKTLQECIDRQVISVKEADMLSSLAHIDVYAPYRESACGWNQLDAYEPKAVKARAALVESFYGAYGNLMSEEDEKRLNTLANYF